MADEKPLTKSGLVAALREIGVATKDNVRLVVGEEIAARGLAKKAGLQGLVIKADLKELREAIKDDLLEMLAQFEVGEIDPHLGKIDGRLEKIEADVTFIRRDIRDLKTDAPTQKEFNELKAKVDKYYPAA